jgi:hypothetical protein
MSSERVVFSFGAGSPEARKIPIKSDLLMPPHTSATLGKTTHPETCPWRPPIETYSVVQRGRTLLNRASCLAALMSIQGGMQSALC